MRVHKIALLAILALIILAGCIQSEEKPVKPEETPKEKVFYAKYAFDKNTALFHRLRIESTIDGNALPTQVIETVTIPLQITPDYTRIEIIMLKAFKIDENGVADICNELSYESKYAVVNLFVDGRVDYGTFSVTNFYIPQRALHIGDSWQFEGITYVIEEETKVETPAGSFNVLKIALSGKKAFKYGFKDINVTLFFDYVNNRIAKYIQTEAFGNYRKKIVMELIDVKKYYEEPPLDCVFSMVGLSPIEKYVKAYYLNMDEKYKSSLYYALSAKKDLEQKDMNAEEKRLYVDLLELIIDDYRQLGEKDSELKLRLEAANAYSELFNEALADGIANAQDYIASKKHLEIVADSNTRYAEQAIAKLSELTENLLGIIHGSVLLKDSEEYAGTTVELFDLNRILRSEVASNSRYDIPIIGNNSEQVLALYLYRKGYMPEFLVRKASVLLSGDMDFVLDPLSDADVNKAIIIGTCYTSEGFGNAKLIFEDANASIEIDCNSFYIALLEPSDYNIFVVKNEQKPLLDSIAANEPKAYVKHLLLTENN